MSVKIKSSQHDVPVRESFSEPANVNSLTRPSHGRWDRKAHVLTARVVTSSANISSATGAALDSHQPAGTHRSLESLATEVLKLSHLRLLSIIPAHCGL